jgi:hypothetical protein
LIDGSPARTPFAHRLRDTAIAPARLARSLEIGAPWVDALVVSTALAVLAAAFTPESVILAGVDDAVTRRGEPVEITSSPGEIVRWGRYLAMLAALVGNPLIVIALAGLLSLVFGVLGGGPAGFRQHLALAAHAAIILGVGNAIAAITGADLSVGSALPFLLDAGPAGQVLNIISPFTVWMLLVLAVGVSVMNQPRSRIAAAAVLLGGYVVMAATVIYWIP